jgi:hypothetical protein
MIIFLRGQSLRVGNMLRTKTPAAKQSFLISDNTKHKITFRPITLRNATIVNGTGKYLIPGLGVMHLHFFINSMNKSKEFYFPLFMAKQYNKVLKG